MLLISMFCINKITLLKRAFALKQVTSATVQWAREPCFSSVFGFRVCVCNPPTFENMVGYQHFGEPTSSSMSWPGEAKRNHTETYNKYTKLNIKLDSILSESDRIGLWLGIYFC